MNATQQFSPVTNSVKPRCNWTIGLIPAAAAILLLVIASLLAALFGIQQAANLAIPVLAAAFVMSALNWALSPSRAAPLAIS